MKTITPISILFCISFATLLPSFLITEENFPSANTSISIPAGYVDLGLPTEAEWEYAARGGRKSQGYKYSGSNTLGNVAWNGDNSGGETHPVKTKYANELGIYDMSGNVLEWCQDWRGSYSGSSQTNPKGPSSGSSRVSRGGSWLYSARHCRVSIRFSNAPGLRNYFIGFRLAL